MLLLALSLWLGVACVAQAKGEKADKAKAHQQMMQQVSKSGLRGQELRELGTAIKKDDTLGQAVQGALDKGLRGRELADCIQTEMKKRQPATADAAGNGMGPGKGMGQGGQGMGKGGMGMGKGMGQGGMGGGMSRRHGPRHGHERRHGARHGNGPRRNGRRKGNGPRHGRPAVVTRRPAAGNSCAATSVGLVRRLTSAERCRSRRRSWASARRVVRLGPRRT